MSSKLRHRAHHGRYLVAASLTALVLPAVAGAERQRERPTRMKPIAEVERVRGTSAFVMFDALAAAGDVPDVKTFASWPVEDLDQSAEEISGQLFCILDVVKDGPTGLYGVRRVDTSVTVDVRRDFSAETLLLLSARRRTDKGGLTRFTGKIDLTAFPEPPEEWVHIYGRGSTLGGKQIQGAGFSCYLHDFVPGECGPGECLGGTYRAALYKAGGRIPASRTADDGLRWEPPSSGYVYAELDESHCKEQNLNERYAEVKIVWRVDGAEAARLADETTRDAHFRLVITDLVTGEQRRARLPEEAEAPLRFDCH